MSRVPLHLVAGFRRPRAVCLLVLLMGCGLFFRTGLRADPAPSPTPGGPAKTAAAHPAASPAKALAKATPAPAHPPKRKPDQTAVAQARRATPVEQSEPTSFLLATSVPDEDPLPAKSPAHFDPDPGGYTPPTTTAPADAPAVVPSLFEPVLPPAPKKYTGPPIPYKLRLPRTALVRNTLQEGSLPYPKYELTDGGVGLLPNRVPEENRWQIAFDRFARYSDHGEAETPYQDSPLRFFDPYKASLLKGDSPIIGQDIFLSVTFEDQEIDEFRRTPEPSGVSAAQAGSTDFYGRGDSYTIQNNLSATIELFKGETSFKPIDWAVHITPIFNFNFSEFLENGIVNPDPRGPNYTAANPQPRPPLNINNPGDVGTLLDPELKNIKGQDLGGSRYTQRSRETVSLEEAFVEIHLYDLDDNYDFISARAGNQLLNSDFRGFIFDDTNSGIRIFGNYDNNRLQYNLAYFNMREKDTFSDLNQFSARGQDVIIANVYRQDFLNLFFPASDPLALGYTAQLSLHADLDHGDVHYDKDGFLMRPAPIGGPIAPHDVNALYFGWAGDGHIGWLNLTHAAYEVVGRDELNGLAGHAVDINAQMVAFELSVDHDYVRPKLSFLYASGDSNPRGGTATGFDSIEDNPTFIGSPFSFYERQGLELGNTAILAKPSNTLLLDFRTSKSEGQANFVNPGTLIAGLGLDVTLTPKLKAQFNANYIRFVDTEPIKLALETNVAAKELGYDVSLGFTYRPTLTNNIIINAGMGFFFTGAGYRDIYKELTTPVPGYTVDPAGAVDSVLYSAIFAVTFTY